jgi:cytochrome c551/c552
MTERLSETISINQKIKFILQLFQGDSDQFNQLIDFIDQEATADNWQEIVNAKYQKMLNADNQDAWKELFELIQRKFN